MKALEKIGLAAALVYVALIVAVIVGWVGNLVHAFSTTDTTDLILTLAGVVVAPLGVLKFYFF